MPAATRVKICGVNSPEVLRATIDAGADMAGFVFFAKSPRNLGLEQARALGTLAAGKIIKVALVVDAPDVVISAIVEALQPDWLQLHGRETSGRITEIQARFGLPVMKAIGISARVDLERGFGDSASADQWLFDAKPPKHAVLPGGNGVAFDWTILSGMKLDKPWMLSGGLDAENVASAIALSAAPGVDVSSGVESAPGLKDLAKIAAFVANARRPLVVRMKA